MNGHANVSPGEHVKAFVDTRKKCLSILKKIDTLLDELERIDPYGDIVQNFEDTYRERQTKRLIKMIEDEMSGMKTRYPNLNIWKNVNW